MGIFIDSGASITSVVPIYYGSVIHHAVKIANVGGDDVNEIFMNLQTNSVKKSVFVNKKVLKAIHENCYVSSNFEQELSENGYVPSNEPNLVVNGFEKKKPELEKKSMSEEISVGVESFVAPEIFFRPQLLQKTNYSKSLDHVVLDAIRHTPPLLHQHFLQNIYLVGENTKFPGLKERLTEEIHKKVPQFPVTVHERLDHKFDAWHGAKQFSTTTPNFLDLCVDSQDYQNNEHNKFL